MFSSRTNNHHPPHHIDSTHQNVIRTSVSFSLSRSDQTRRSSRASRAPSTVMCLSRDREECSQSVQIGSKEMSSSILTSRRASKIYFHHLSSVLCLLFLFIVLFCASVRANEEFKCPRNQFYLFPCRCLSGGYKGLNMTCNKANLATVSLALGNVKSPIEHLVIEDSNVVRLFGPLFKERTILSLTMRRVGLVDVDEESIAGLKANIRELVLDENRLTTLPAGVNVLMNLTRLSVVNTATLVEVRAVGLKRLTTLVELDLHNNSIKKIEASSFTPLTLLERLSLRHNELVKLERNLFRSNKKLAHVDLSHNRFREFGKSDFNDLTGVQVLDLSYNQLKDLPRSSFSRMSQLRELNLSGNQLKQLDAYMLRGVRWLKEFYASNNLIREMSKNSFSSTTRIRIIDLSSNSLENVETEIFKDMQYLDVLDLSRNQITTLKHGAFSRMFKIAINLAHNNISAISPNAFMEIANITELDLSHNQISELSPNIFHECDLTHFHLNHNRIRNLSELNIFAGLAGIRMLNLSFNEIVEVTRQHFTPKKLYELSVLDLSHNHIAELSGGVFEKFLSLRGLNLTQNRLTKISGSSFGKLATLLELDISHNQIEEISGGGLSQLQSVKTVFANNNYIKNIFQISTAVNVIHLENNRIASIRRRTFPMINALLELYLDNNLISKLDDGSFDNCLSLNTVGLRNNSFEDVPARALAVLTSLQNLDLSYNRLTHLPHHAFGSLRILFHLKLHHNQIADMAPNTFEGLLQLLTLDLNSNQIGKINTDVFNTMVSLRDLDLSYNRITSLDNGTHSIFEPILSIDRLNLSHNAISIIRDRSFPHSPWIPYKLRELDLSHNTIPVLTKNFDNGLGELQWLSLAGNIINEVQLDVLGNLTELQHLDFSSNDLRRLTPGIFRPTMTKLQRLNLSNNKISTLTVGEIARMTSLKALDLSGNRLTTLEQPLFEPIKKGLDVRFKGNRLFCDCKLMPLIAWAYSEKHRAQLEGRESSSVYEHWSQLACQEPSMVRDKRITEVRAEMLDCSVGDVYSYKKKFVGTRAIKIRTIEKFRKRRQDSIKLVWFVQSRLEDIAYFNVLLRSKEDAENTFQVNETITYLKRDFIFTNLPSKQSYVVCIFPIDSYGKVREDFVHDCHTFFNAPTGIQFTDSDDREDAPLSTASDGSISRRGDRHRSTTSTSSASSNTLTTTATITGSILLLVASIFVNLRCLVYLFTN